MYIETQKVLWRVKRCCIRKSCDAYSKNLMYIRKILMYTLFMYILNCMFEKA